MAEQQLRQGGLSPRVVAPESPELPSPFALFLREELSWLQRRLAQAHAQAVLEAVEPTGLASKGVTWTNERPGRGGDALPAMSPRPLPLVWTGVTGTPRRTQALKKPGSLDGDSRSCAEDPEPPSNRSKVAEEDLEVQAEAPVAQLHGTWLSVESKLDDERQEDVPQPVSRVASNSSSGLGSGSSGGHRHRRVSRASLKTAALWLTSAGSQARESDTRFDKIVKSNLFEGFFMMVIILNCATMGMEAHYAANQQTNDIAIFLELSEHIFTLLFSLELVARIRVLGIFAFTPNKTENIWNFIDAVLVLVTGVLFVWIVPLIALVFGFDVSTSAEFRLITVFRALRLIRLVRVVQKVRFFHEVWMLLRGLLESVRTLFWTCVVIFFLTYGFAVFGMVLISRPLVDYRQIALADLEANGADLDAKASLEALNELLEYVGSLDSFMYTLIQVLVGDSWNAIVRGIVVYSPASWVYFYLYTAVAVFVLMNLVTAIIVENALSTAREDAEQDMLHREKRRAQEITKLNALFHMMDTDGDGTLSWSEFKAAFDNPELTKRWRLLDFQPDECKELFHLLDTGDGNIDMNEFFDGLKRMKGTAQSRDLFRVMRSVDRLTAVLGDPINETQIPMANDVHDQQALF